MSCPWTMRTRIEIERGPKKHAIIDEVSGHCMGIFSILDHLGFLVSGGAGDIDFVFAMRVGWSIDAHGCRRDTPWRPPNASSESVLQFCE
eukprot:3278318-Amphidinium_carterae.1